MKILKVVVAFVVIVAISTTAVAGEVLLQAGLKARTTVTAGQKARTTAGLGHAGLQARTTADAPTRSITPTMPKTYLWAGSALFVGGMAVALNGFLNNRNGEFPEFGEARSTNVRMGAAGLGAAFGGGLLLFLGKERAAKAPSVTIARRGFALSKEVRWWRGGLLYLGPTNKGETFDHVDPPGVPSVPGRRTTVPVPRPERGDFRARPNRAGCAGFP